MASITIRNIPDSLLEKLKARAKEQRRSVNNEIIKILEDAKTTGDRKKSLTEILDELGKDSEYAENVLEAYKNRSYGRDINL